VLGWIVARVFNQQPLKHDHVALVENQSVRSAGDELLNRIQHQAGPENFLSESHMKPSLASRVVEAHAQH
jgi:hypothetical protein